MDKLVEWVDENGVHRVSRLPDDAPDSQAALGIPVEFDFSELGYPEEFYDRLYEHLWRLGYRTKEDFLNDTQAVTKIRRAIMAIVRMDANAVYACIIKE